MCPCDLARYIVCGYHARPIEEAWREEQALTKRAGNLSVHEALDLRVLRAGLLGAGLAAEIVIHQIKTREWEEANA